MAVESPMGGGSEILIALTDGKGTGGTIVGVIDADSPTNNDFGVVMRGISDATGAVEYFMNHTVGDITPDPASALKPKRAKKRALLAP